MKDMFEEITGFIRNKAWLSFTDCESKTAIIFFKGRYANFAVDLVLEEEKRQLSICGHFPLNCPEELMGRVEELFSQNNPSKIDFEFGYGPEQGDIVIIYKMDVNPKQKRPDQAEIDKIISGVKRIIDELSPGLAHIIYGAPGPSLVSDSGTNPDQDKMKINISLN